MTKRDVAVVIVFGLSWLNSLLVAKGMHPLPLVDEAQAASFITFVISVYTMVRDNPFKKKPKPPTQDGLSKQ